MSRGRRRASRQTLRLRRRCRRPVRRRRVCPRHRRCRPVRPRRRLGAVRLRRPRHHPGPCPRRHLPSRPRQQPAVNQRQSRAERRMRRRSSPPRRRPPRLPKDRYLPPTKAPLAWPRMTSRVPRCSRQPTETGRPPWAWCARDQRPVSRLSCRATGLPASAPTSPQRTAPIALRPRMKVTAVPRRILPRHCRWRSKSASA